MNAIVLDLEVATNTPADAFVRTEGLAQTAGKCGHGQTCDPATGVCLICAAGRSGFKCEQNCPKGFWGVGCSEKCFCDADGGSCNSIDGTCECALGFTSKYCDQKCPAETWGFNCSQKCRHCLNGVTAKATGRFVTRPRDCANVLRGTLATSIVMPDFGGPTV
uniref:EGF-like domain-containing protein n=1 Tax=Globodera pallida TaxID=36090 RepID=A0A183BJ07_GLOPA